MKSRCAPWQTGQANLNIYSGIIVRCESLFQLGCLAFGSGLGNTLKDLSNPFLCCESILSLTWLGIEMQMLLLWIFGPLSCPVSKHMLESGTAEVCLPNTHLSTQSRNLIWTTSCSSRIFGRPPAKLILLLAGHFFTLPKHAQYSKDSSNMQQWSSLVTFCEASSRACPGKKNPKPWLISFRSFSSKRIAGRG